MWRPPGREFACSPFPQGFPTSRLPQGSHPEVQPRDPGFFYPRSIPPGNFPLRSPFPSHLPVNQPAVSVMMQRSPFPYVAPYQTPFLHSPHMRLAPRLMMNMPLTTSPSPGVALSRPESPAFNRGPWNSGGSPRTGQSIGQEPLLAAALDQYIEEKRPSKNSMLQGSTSMRQSISCGQTSDKPNPVKDRAPPSLSQGKSHNYQQSPCPQTTKSLSYSQRRTTFQRKSERKRHQDNRRNHRSRDNNGDFKAPRCYSPPPPGVKRVMKYVMPERFYTRSKKAQDAAFFVQGTDELRGFHKNFEREILNMACPVGQDDSNDDIWPVRRKESNSDKASSESNLMDGGANELNDRDSELSSVSDYEGESDVEIGYQVTNVSSSESCEDDNDDDDDDSGNSNDDVDEEEDKDAQLHQGPSLEETRKRKIEHPQRLHPELWFNEQGETNDGPVCRCSAADKKQGIRHGIYPGEKAIPKCNPLKNNCDVLHHYWVTVTPHTNFMTENPTVIRFDGKDYTFEGFSLFSHEPVEQVPPCSVIRFNIEYFIHVIKEPIPQNFCVQDLLLFSQFLFHKVLELSDWDLNGKMPDVCERYHFMPRFVHRCSDNSDADEEHHELLSMNHVLSHILDSAEPLIKPHHLSLSLIDREEYVKSCVNSIVRRPDKKPAAIRVDDLKFDKETEKSSCKKVHPYIVHHSVRPIQMSFAGDPKYQRLWRTFIKLRNLVSNTPVPRRRDEDKLVQLKVELATIRMASSMRRDLLVEVSGRSMMKTGLKSDVCQHGLLLPVLVHHLRYHMSLHTLDKKMGYTFTNRSLLQLSLTHPSYHLNFGTNPDHARNSLSNCGVKQPRYGDRKIRQLHTRKKGITQLIRVMSNLGKMEEHQSMIRHNERLEYLGDAVLEFICSTHLYFMFPTNSEGELAMYRSALVQNKHLAQLAKKLGLSDYMQYAHGSDLCLEEDLNHAMANCFEALLGALFLESGLESATKFFTEIAFEEEELREVWTNLPKHPLQVQQPHGDRHLVSSSTLLQKLVEFEKASGIEFTHIRLLARAFTHPQVGFNNLTLGSNQRMEFLGDSLFKFVVSEFLFKHFPDHHEGHLTLLRSSLVNRRIQAAISRDLGLDKLINFGSTGLKAYREKFLADVLEAFVAALYVDKDLQHVEVLFRVCLFPRLEDLIINQDWIDAKSQLQQCCLTVREEGKAPDVPQYRILQSKGPAHHKRYTVAVYWKGKRMGSGEGKSRRQAEMLAAKDALTSRYFPEIARQKHILDRKHRGRRRNYWNKQPRKLKEKNSGQGEYEPRWEEKESFEERGQKRKFRDEDD